MYIPTEDVRPIDGSATWFQGEDGTCCQLQYDEIRDIWTRHDGAEFVRNGSVYSDPVWIRVDTDLWRCRYLGGTYVLRWENIHLPAVLKSAIRAALLVRLQHCVPTILSVWHQMLRQVSTAIAELNFSCPRGFRDLTTNDLIQVLANLKAGAASEFRSVYRVLVSLGADGCEIEQLRLLNELRLNRYKKLEYVTTWHPQKGALTTSELEVLKHHLWPSSAPETDIDHFCRVLLRTFVALGRRPSQLMGVLSDGVRLFDKDPSFPAIIEVPGAKHQRNNRSEWWPITTSLYDDLMGFAQRSKIHEAQQKFGYFFVTPITCTSRPTGRRSGWAVAAMLSEWIGRRNIVSPRTRRPLHITPTRLRHTAATQMARKGYALEDIQSFLEHDSDSAVLSYLDAVGNDLAPALDRANDVLGDVFGTMSRVFFRGRVVDRPKSPISKPIAVPNLDKRAIVGQCGLVGTCPKHPFSACLNGCPHFLFFKDADVPAARAFLNDQYEHWRGSEANALRTKAHDDFARIDRALTEAAHIAEASDE
ncbi:site-specific integrase [Brucella anthropi]|uniref:site-specific integrase n=1 Tax=Brucella anthropi TaxID=529 RepID=UPI0002E03769|nr:site-specific integrase [Brucella anthropi]